MEISKLKQKIKILTHQLEKNEGIIEKIEEGKGNELFYSQKLQLLESNVE